MPVRRAFLAPLVLTGGLLLGACEDDGGDGGDAAGDLGAFCDRVREFDAVDSQDDAQDAERWEELARVAPEEVREDVGTIAEALTEADGDPEAADRVLAAGERVIPYIEENCDIDLPG